MLSASAGLRDIPKVASRNSLRETAATYNNSGGTADDMGSWAYAQSNRSYAFRALVMLRPRSPLEGASAAHAASLTGNQERRAQDIAGALLNDRSQQKSLMARAAAWREANWCAVYFPGAAPTPLTSALLRTGHSPSSAKIAPLRAARMTAISHHQLELARTAVGAVVHCSAPADRVPSTRSFAIPARPGRCVAQQFTIASIISVCPRASAALHVVRQACQGGTGLAAGTVSPSRC